MNVTSITVIKSRHSMDRVILKTDLPSPVPHVTSDQNSLLFMAEHGKGVEYVQRHFPGISVRIIDDPT